MRPDGIIERYAGRTGTANITPPPGTPARMAFFDDIERIQVAANGDLYLTMLTRVYVITPEGGFRVAAGGPQRCTFGTQITVCDPVQPMVRGLATTFRFGGSRNIALFPDGRILVADARDSRRRVITPAFPGFNENDILVASEDGGAVYQFNQYGRHLRTLDAMTRDTVLAFAYDAAGWLTSVTDADGEVTTIERSGSVASAIVGPAGQRTELGYDANGYLNEVSNSAGERVLLATSESGLLQSMTDPRGDTFAFAYDSLGRLVSDSSAAGRVQTVARIETDTSSVVTLADDLGRSTVYRLDRLAEQRARAP